MVQEFSRDGQTAKAIPRTQFLNCLSPNPRLHPKEFAAGPPWLICMGLGWEWLPGLFWHLCSSHLLPVSVAMAAPDQTGPFSSVCACVPFGVGTSTRKRGDVSLLEC